MANSSCSLLFLALRDSTCSTYFLYSPLGTKFRQTPHRRFLVFLVTVPKGNYRPGLGDGFRNQAASEEPQIEATVLSRFHSCSSGSKVYFHVPMHFVTVPIATSNLTSGNYVWLPVSWVTEVVACPKGN